MCEFLLQKTQTIMVCKGEAKKKKARGKKNCLEEGKVAD